MCDPALNTKLTLIRAYFKRVGKQIFLLMENKFLVGLNCEDIHIIFEIHTYKRFFGYFW